jgi:hypothetical protein
MQALFICWFYWMLKNDPGMYVDGGNETGSFSIAGNKKPRIGRGLHSNLFLPLVNLF